MNARTFIVGLFGSLIALSAGASLVTFNFGGHLTLVSSPALSSLFAIGDVFSGSFTFESTTPDSNPGPNGGDYEPVDMTFSISVGSLSHSGPLLPPPSLPPILIQNGSSDFYSVF
jgi:hypothetical protein